MTTRHELTALSQIADNLVVSEKDKSEAEEKLHQLRHRTYIAGETKDPNYPLLRTQLAQGDMLMDEIAENYRARH